MAGINWERIVRDVVRAVLRSIGIDTRPSRSTHRRKTSTSSKNARPTTKYPGDYRGLPDLKYGANRDKIADPGEVIWAWIPFEEDFSQGKDRPALVVGYDGGWVLALPMSSQDHASDRAQEQRAGRYWLELGAGNWDSQARTSWVRVDRIVRVNPADVRRHAGEIDRATFNRVASGLRRHWRD